MGFVAFGQNLNKTNRSLQTSRRNYYRNKIYKNKSIMYQGVGLDQRLISSKSKQQVESNKQSVRAQIRYYQILGWVKTVVVVTVIGISIYLLFPQISGLVLYLFR